MLNISQVSFMSAMPRVQLQQKFNKVAFGNDSAEAVDTFEKKDNVKAELDKAWQLEKEGKPEEAEAIIRPFLTGM